MNATLISTLMLACLGVVTSADARPPTPEPAAAIEVDRGHSSATGTRACIYWNGVWYC